MLVSRLPQALQPEVKLARTPTNPPSRGLAELLRRSAKPAVLAIVITVVSSCVQAAVRRGYRPNATLQRASQPDAPYPTRLTDLAQPRQASDLLGPPTERRCKQARKFERQIQSALQGDHQRK